MAQEQSESQSFEEQMALARKHQPPIAQATNHAVA
jgi:hypothetical protein